MSPEDFELLVARAWNAMPERFRARVANVALLVEDEPSEAVRREEGLGPHDTLLGLYQGVNLLARGELYGVGGTVPDTITLYRLPLLTEAEHLARERDLPFEKAMEEAVRETLWHEVGHYFGLSEHAVRTREDEGTNAF